MRPSWKWELIEQLDWHWQHHLRPRLDGLTDDEYLWEPVAGCWSLRRRGEERTSRAAGLGDVVADFDDPAPVPAPVTTIAWRMGHIAVGCFGVRASNQFGDGSVSRATTDWPLTAEGGLALLDRHHRSWMDAVRRLDKAGLEAPCGPTEGPFSEHPVAGLIFHVNREVIHHGAEIALLRDLYARRF